MTVYVVAQITIHDRESYDRYASRFIAVLRPFGGYLLAADESPRVVEGKWPHQKIILLSFENTEAFQTWYRSEAYQAIAHDRIAAATGPVLLVKGVS